MPRPYGRRVRRPDERPLRALIAGVTAGTSTRVPSSPFASGVACCTNTPATRRTRTARRRSISIRPSERGHAEATIGPRIISQSLLRRHWRLRCEAHTDDVTRSLLTTGLGADWFRVFLSKGGRAGIGRPRLPRRPRRLGARRASVVYRSRRRLTARVPLLAAHADGQLVPVRPCPPRDDVRLWNARPVRASGQDSLLPDSSSTADVACAGGRRDGLDRPRQRPTVSAAARRWLQVARLRRVPPRHNRDRESW
jgi:hypothetical protein